LLKRKDGAKMNPQKDLDSFHFFILFLVELKTNMVTFGTDITASVYTNTHIQMSWTVSHLTPQTLKYL